MQMAEGEPITIKIGAEDDKIRQCVQPENKSPNESSSVLTDLVGESCGKNSNENSMIQKNRQRKVNTGRSRNETKDVVDLTAIDSHDDVSNSSTTRNSANVNNIDASNSGSIGTHSPGTIIDLLPIATEMWKFNYRKINQLVALACTHLPATMHNAIIKTTILQFQKRQTLPGETEEYTPKARFYIDLLRSHNKRLASEPFKLVALKCAFCMDQPKHVQGCCSFIRVSNGEDMPRLLSDALHQRLIHLETSCENAKRMHGADVSSIFSSKYDRNDVNLKSFVHSWLQELQSTTHDEEQRRMRRINLAEVGMKALGPPTLSAEERLRLHERARAHALDDRTTKYMRKGMKLMHAPANAVGGPTSAFNRNQSLPLMAAQRRQQAMMDQQKDQQFLLLKQRLQQRNQQQQLLQQQHTITPNYPMHFSIPQLTPQQHNIFIQQTQQQPMIRQQNFVGDNQWDINQLHQRQQPQVPQHNQQQQQQIQQQQQPIQQQQQLKQQQKPKPRQRYPQIFPRSKKISFEELEKTYEEYWEETTWSAFNPPYDSEDDDDDKADDYFNSIYGKSNETDGEKTHEEPVRSLRNSPLSQSEQKLDFYLPIQTYQLAQCQGDGFFLKDDDTVTTTEKVRGRPRKSVEFSPIDVTLPDVTHRDVVMMCDGCPVVLAKALHDLEGNRRFLRLVSAKRSAFIDASSDTERMTIAKELIQNIKKRGGSFLKANTVRKKTARTWKASDKEVEDYARFRLEQGFPDILNNPKIGKRLFKCSTPGAKSRSLTASVPVPKKESAESAKSQVIDLSSVDDAPDTPASTEPTSSSPHQEANDLPIKVFEVEYAPMVGMINGFLEWNNNKTNNPIKKLPRLKISPPHVTKQSVTAPTIVDDEDGVS